MAARNKIVTLFPASMSGHYVFITYYSLLIHRLTLYDS